ncbi:MAG: aminotransferase class I/II-fold pyridoxal phosphate-dependent enzyme [Gammaproteobacteria bacterium]|nr:aminotransferase class I/II-fold pyridoxal phosphate-dependent enzyme [Gammaproteobacteria bacterium]
MKSPAKRMLSQAQKNFGMYETAARIAAQDPSADIIHLEVGRPSFDTPLHIKEAAKTALDKGIVHYGELNGTFALRDALAQRYRELNRIDVSADEILVTNGVTQAAFSALMTLIDEGDEVIVLDPFYPQHNSKIELLGGKVVTVKLDQARGFSLDAQALDEAVSPATKMIILVNPSNPTGVMYSQKDLLAIRDIAIKHDLYVLSDEVYEFNIYDDNKHISIASLPDMRERTITISAFTKGYAMDGWRIGYAAAPLHFISEMLKVTLNESTHPCIFAQEGAIAAVSGSQDCVKEMVADDKLRRDLIVSRLNAMPGVTCNTPQATIYAFPDFSAWGIESSKLAQDIVEHTHVAVESGCFYGNAGKGHLRICFGSEPYERLEEALDRMEAYLQSLELPLQATATN